MEFKIENENVRRNSKFNILEKNEVDGVAAAFFQLLREDMNILPTAATV